MKKYLAPMIVFGSFLWLMGMGDLGGAGPANKIPTPEKSFSVKVVDGEGIQTSLSQFSQEGKVFLTGKRGNATVAIPFEKIFQIQFQTGEGNDSQAKVILRGRESIDVKVDKRAKFYGRAEFGTFQIEAKDLRSIHFSP